MACGHGIQTLMVSVQYINPLEYPNLVFVKHNIFHSKHLVFIKLSISKLGVRQMRHFPYLNMQHFTNHSGSYIGSIPIPNLVGIIHQAGSMK